MNGNGMALTVRGQMSMADAMTAAQHMAASGFFTDARDVSQAVVKVLAGQELGLGPFASMTGISIIKGRPALGANLIATLIKNDPRYDYRVAELTDSVCSIAFFEGGAQLGVSTFTAKDAAKAGTQNMSKFPRNMLFARAISNGAKWYTPGIFGGAPVYTPDELGAQVDEDGYIVGEVVQDTHMVPGGWLDETGDGPMLAQDTAGEAPPLPTFERQIRAASTPAQFATLAMQEIHRYTSTNAIKAALKEALGITAYPVKGDAQEVSDRRWQMFTDLAEYAQLRDAGMDKERALAAMADGLFSGDEEE